MALANLREDVFALCQELQGQFDFNPGHVDSYINKGVRAFVRDTHCIEDQLDVTSVANQFEYSQSDLSSIGRIYRINEVRHIEGSEVGRKLKPYPGGYSGLPEEFVYGRPEYYFLRGMLSQDSNNNAKRLGVWPIDSSSGNTIRLQVNMFPEFDLSGDGDSPYVPDAWQEAIVFHAAAWMFRKYGHMKPQWRRKYLELKMEYQELVNNYHENASVEYSELMCITEV